MLLLSVFVFSLLIRLQENGCSYRRETITTDQQRLTDHAHRFWAKLTKIEIGRTKNAMKNERSGQCLNAVRQVTGP